MKTGMGTYLMYRTGKRGASLAAFSVLFVALMLLAGSTDVGAAGTDLRKATVAQKGRSLVTRIEPGREFSISKLERQPDFARPKARYLCIEMRGKGEKRLSRICIGGKRKTRDAAGFARITSAGKALTPKTIPVKVSGTSAGGLTVSFVPGRAHVVPGPYSWRVLFSTGACTEATDDCRSSYPRKGFADYRVRPVEIVGCTGGNGQVVKRGPAGKKQVALTFDDGPSIYTPQVLDILRRKKVKATFFMLGDMVSADPAAARRVLAAGHEIANHSSSHSLLPSYSNISRAGRAIRRATGFKPCLFRPPYGALNSSVISSARSLDMKSILWDIDTSDWSTPGTGTIRARVSSAGPGSIVLMHDGGGPRSQTVAALSGAIHNLRARGYEFVTVTKLLGNRFIYRPR
jgi:peptidoglycan/xylan/chitin deacetylase (PgdA/CDA1 family)